MSQSGQTFSEPQKQYLSGLAYGVDVARAIARLPVLSNSGSGDVTVQVGGTQASPDKAVGMYSGPDRAAMEAQDAVLATGQTLSKEEQAKRAKNGLDCWDQVQQRADKNEFPTGTDVFLTKFHGLFYVAPAEKAFMCRMRIAGGLLHSWQMRGISAIARELAGGYVDVTTRANLQLREIAADKATELLYRLRELDITCQGSGADNIRNCTASPLSGLDPHELIETIPLAKRMHYYILANRDLYGLPRKFNIAFEGGGQIASLDDTNDIGFRAVQIDEDQANPQTPAGVYFQLTLGGITGHRDFARNTGVLLTPDECIPVAAAIVRIFIRNGDRTDRKKARLKYVLDAWGFERFIAELETELGKSLQRFEVSDLNTSNENRFAHVGIHPQKQAGLHYIGVVLPVGRITSLQAAALADIAERYSNSEIRLTVWQNLIIPNVREENLDKVKIELEQAGLEYQASSFRAGLVACTGNAGCKFAAANTKLHAMRLAEHLESQFAIDRPINIHVTGCHHSCAQHYIGDIGLLACSVDQGDDSVEGYHIHVGGGWGKHQSVGRLLFESVAVEDCMTVLSQLVGGYLRERQTDEEFAEFVARRSDEALRGLVLQTA